MHKFTPVGPKNSVAKTLAAVIHIYIYIQPVLRPQMLGKAYLGQAVEQSCLGHDMAEIRWGGRRDLR